MKTAPQQQTATRFAYSFDEALHGGRELLGGKGLGLAEMAHLEVPVPAGFTITTDACRAYMAAGGDLPPGLEEEIAEHICRLEHATGASFGDPFNPLLVSVRSGAAISMPGMMDTILDLGLNDETALGLAAATGNGRFAYDSYRRLIQMYGEVVEGIDSHAFEQALDELKQRRGFELRRRAGRDRPAGADRHATTRSTSTRRGIGFPLDAHDQLLGADPRGLRVLELAASARLPADLRDPGRPRHRRQRDADGVREQGRQLRHRRLLQPRPLHRRRAASAASSSSTPRARTSSRVSGCRSRSTTCARSFPRHSASSSGRWRRSRRTTATCRTSSSRSRRGGCTSCRPVPPSAPRRPPCAPRSRWWRRDC